MSEFNRENRYLVLKRKDMDTLSAADLSFLLAIEIKVNIARRIKQKLPFEAVVVESHWPEYEPVWNAIEKRCAKLNPVEYPLDILRGESFIKQTVDLCEALKTLNQITTLNLESLGKCDFIPAAAQHSLSEIRNAIEEFNKKMDGDINES